MSTLPTTPSFRLDGRRAVVTGAGRGLGLACAAALAGAGAQVTLVSRSTDELSRACEDINQQFESRADFVALDVTDSKAVRSFFEERGAYHVVVNNAGMNRPKFLVDHSDQDIHDIFDLNVKAVLYVCREATRQLLKYGERGSIINVSSQMGLVGSPRRSLYCSSKHAVEGLTKALAWELGPSNIRVNAICPTFIETAMTAPMFQDQAFKTFVLDKIALGRLGQPEEIMGAVVFLASDAASLITGAELPIDGGWTAA